MVLQALQQRLQPIEKLEQWQQQAGKPLQGHEQRNSNAAAGSHKAEAEIADLTSDLLQLLRLYCCSFRRSLRHATKRLHEQMKAAKANGKEAISYARADGSMDSVLSLVIDLVQVTSKAVKAIEMVSLPVSDFAECGPSSPSGRKETEHPRAGAMHAI